MPELDGLELQSRLAELDDTPLLLISGASGAQEAVSAFRGGAMDFLSKPIDADVLLDAIAKALAESKTRQLRRGRRHAPQRSRRWLPVAFFLKDISADMAAEVQLRLAASVFANSQEGITSTDAGGYIVDVNPAFTRITGDSRDEVLGRSPKMLSSGHQDAAFYARMFDALRETGAWRGEIWNRNKAGEVYPKLLSIAAVTDGQGLLSHYIDSFSDLTHMKDREMKLDRLAHYDPLIGLPNRRLGDRLRQAIAACGHIHLGLVVQHKLSHFQDKR